MIISYEALESKLNYVFKDKKLIELALTHSSKSSINNEKLELLGDSVVGLAVTNFLYNEFTDQDEGLLSLLKSKLVSRAFLAKVADQIDLKDFISVGKSVTNDQNENNSIVGNAFEAILGAIYLDSDFETSAEITITLIANEIGTLSLDDTKDSKTILQEELQKRKIRLPLYESIQNDEDNDQFKSVCSIEELDLIVHGIGVSKKDADQDAAKKILGRLKDND
ncbi:ribonuclease III [SAR86 cluster bacterium]|nr:ribonuclease III [SAR86 cluster bacterium]